MRLQPEAVGSGESCTISLLQTKQLQLRRDQRRNNPILSNFLHTLSTPDKNIDRVGRQANIIDNTILFYPGQVFHFISFYPGIPATMQLNPVPNLRQKQCSFFESPCTQVTCYINPCNKFNGLPSCIILGRFQNKCILSLSIFQVLRIP